VDTAILDRDSLPVGKLFRGPAIVTEYSATTVVPPDASFRIDAMANLIIQAGSQQKRKGAKRGAPR
jgi:N-methylhydantoinase A